MPEYSTPTLTPAGTSKLTGMNGSSAGNFLVSDILDIIRNTFGQANGVATLDGSGKLPTAQLPDIADDVLVYASKALLPAQGVAGRVLGPVAVAAEDDLQACIARHGEEPVPAVPGGP